MDSINLILNTYLYKSPSGGEALSDKRMIMKLKNILLAGATACGMTACQSTGNLTTEMLGGNDGQEWQVMKIGQKSVTPSDETPFLGFKSDGLLWGFNGCNRLTGSYKLKANGKIDLSKVGCTMMLCPEDTYETIFMSELGKVKQAKMQDNTTLLLADGNGNSLIELTLKNALTPETLNGKWVLVAGKDLQLPEAEDEIPTLTFDVKGQTLSGFTGCNRLTGSFNLKALFQGKTSFGTLGMTRMMCQDNGLERAFMENFNAAARVSIQEGELVLQDSKGAELLRFKKAADK